MLVVSYLVLQVCISFVAFQTEVAHFCFCLANPPARYRSLIPRPATGVFRPEVSPGVSPRVSPKTGGDTVRGSVRRGVSGARVPECPQSVRRVSPQSAGHLFDTPGTLWGHFWTLRSPGPEGPRRHPVGHSHGHPPFSGTLSGTLPGTLRARRARKTPVAGRGIRNFCLVCIKLPLLRCCHHMLGGGISHPTSSC